MRRRRRAPIAGTPTSAGRPPDRHRSVGRERAPPGCDGVTRACGPCSRRAAGRPRARASRSRSTCSNAAAVVFTASSELLGAHERDHEVHEQPDGGDEGQETQGVHNLSNPRAAASTMAARITMMTRAAMSATSSPPSRNGVVGGSCISAALGKTGVLRYIDNARPSRSKAVPRRLGTGAISAPHGRLVRNWQLLDDGADHEGVQAVKQRPRRNTITASRTMSSSPCQAKVPAVSSRKPFANRNPTRPATAAVAGDDHHPTAATTTTSAPKASVGSTRSGRDSSREYEAGDEGHADRGGERQALPSRPRTKSRAGSPRSALVFMAPASGWDCWAGPCPYAFLMRDGRISTHS